MTSSDWLKNKDGTVSVSDFHKTPGPWPDSVRREINRRRLDWRLKSMSLNTVQPRREMACKYCTKNRKWRRLVVSRGKAVM
jgi:hypothetical protein